MYTLKNVGGQLFVRSSVEEMLPLYSLFVSPSYFCSSNYDEKYEYVSRFYELQMSSWALNQIGPATDYRTSPVFEVAMFYRLHTSSVREGVTILVSQKLVFKFLAQFLEVFEKVCTKTFVVGR